MNHGIICYDLFFYPSFSSVLLYKGGGLVVMPGIHSCAVQSHQCSQSLHLGPDGRSDQLCRGRRRRSHQLLPASSSLHQGKASISLDKVGILAIKVMDYPGSN